MTVAETRTAIELARPYGVLLFIQREPVQCDELTDGTYAMSIVCHGIAIEPDPATGRVFLPCRLHARTNFSFYSRSMN